MTKKVSRVLWYPTQAKIGLEWGTQPLLTMKQSKKVTNSRDDKGEGGGFYMGRWIGWAEENSRSLHCSELRFHGTQVARCTFSSSFKECKPRYLRQIVLAQKAFTADLASHFRGGALPVHQVRNPSAAEPVDSLQGGSRLLHHIQQSTLDELFATLHQRGQNNCNYCVFFARQK